MSKQPVFVLLELEVVIFFLAKFELPPFGTEFAVGPALLIGQELFLTNTVVAGLFILVDLAFVVETLQHSLHTFLVQRFRRSRPAIVAHIKLFPERDKFVRESP